MSQGPGPLAPPRLHSCGFQISFGFCSPSHSPNLYTQQSLEMKTEGKKRKKKKKKRLLEQPITTSIKKQNSSQSRTRCSLGLEGPAPPSLPSKLPDTEGPPPAASNTGRQLPKHEAKYSPQPHTAPRTCAVGLTT